MLIGLHGRKQAGKDTAYERLVHRYARLLPVERASFADLLYESAAAAMNVSMSDLRDWKTNDSVSIQIWHNGADGQMGCLGTMSFREYLQRYGTEAHRDVFGSDFWVEQVDLSHEGKMVVVTDVRFPNEAQRIRDAGGIVVRVLGPEEVENAGDSHPSEVPLPDSLISATLRNDVRDDAFYRLDTGLDMMVDGLAMAGHA